jgi:hypothetical protein
MNPKAEARDPKPEEAAAEPSGYFLHGPDSGRGQHAPLYFEMLHHVCHYLTQLGMKPNRVVTVNPRDEVRTLADVSVVLVALLNPFCGIDRLPS